VGIPFYNAASTLEKSVNSVLSQKFAGELEILLLDDGSTDASPAIARAFAARAPKVVRYIRVDHGGVAAARNAIVLHALGEYLAWLDADDVYRRGHLQACLKAMDGSPDRTMVMSDFLHRAATFRIQPFVEDALSSVLRGELPAYLWATLCRTEEYRLTGPFDVSLERCEDQDMIIRYLLSGGRLKAVGGEPSVEYSGTLVGRSGNAAEYAFETLRARYSALYDAMSDRDDYFAARYWKISTYFQANGHLDDMWRCRTAAMRYSPEVASARARKEYERISKRLADLQKAQRNPLVWALFRLKPILRPLRRLVRYL